MPMLLDKEYSWEELYYAANDVDFHISEVLEEEFPGIIKIQIEYVEDQSEVWPWSLFTDDGHG